MKAVTKWIGEDGKATLEGSPDADILAANEGADILADKAISDPKVGKEWYQRTNGAVFKWKKPYREAGKVTYQDRHSTFNNCVRDAIRRGAAENEVQKHDKKLTGAWRQISTV